MRFWAKPPRLLKLLRPICGRPRRGLHGKDDSRIRDMCLDVLALTEGDEALRLNRVEAHEILAILALKEPNTREARHQLQEMGTLLGDDIKAVCLCELPPAPRTSINAGGKGRNGGSRISRGSCCAAPRSTRYRR